MHTPVFYTDKTCYAQYSSFSEDEHCFDGLIISLNGPPSQMGYSNVPYPDSSFTVKSYDLSKPLNSTYNKIWVIVNKSISEADQNIIFNSFQINKTSADSDFSQ